MRRHPVRSCLGVLSAVALLTVGVTPQAVEAQSTATIQGHTEPLGPLTPFAMCVAAQSTSGAFVSATTANLSSGAYSLSVPAGSYAIWYWPCGRRAELGPAASLYRNAFSYDTATLVTVSAGQTVTLQDQDAPPGGGRVSVSVLDADGRPPGSCTVFAYTRTTTPTPLSRTAAGQNGYLLSNLPTGTYDVVADCGPAFYPTFHGNTTESSESVGVAVVAGQLTTGIEITPIRRPRSAAGRLTTIDGGFAYDACVWAVDASGAVVGHASATSNEGYWAMTGLPVGEVRIGFAGCHGDHTYIPEWYDDVPTLAQATSVSIGADAATTQIDAVIGRRTGLHFAFHDAEGDRVSGVCAWITDTTGTTLVTAGFDSGPDVIVDELVPGSYSVLFTDCAGSGFAPEWYQDSSDHDGSTPVVAQDGAVVRYDVVL